MKNLINETNVTVNNNTNEKMEENKMTIKDLLIKGTIDNKEEYEFFVKNNDTIEKEYCNDFTITDVRIYFGGGFAEIYEVENEEKMIQNIRFYTDEGEQVSDYDEARDLTVEEIKEQFEDEIKEKLEKICRWIHQSGNDLTYTLYFDKVQEKVWIMEHTGNSYSGDKNDVALKSYSYQYEDASSDVPSDFFFGYLEEKHEILFGQMAEPCWDELDEDEYNRLEPIWDEYNEKLDEYHNLFWNDYIDWLIDMFVDDWVNIEFDEIRGW